MEYHGTVVIPVECERETLTDTGTMTSSRWHDNKMDIARHELEHTRGGTPADLESRIVFTLLEYTDNKKQTYIWMLIDNK